MSFIKYFFKQFILLRAIVILFNIKNFYIKNNNIIEFVRKNKFKTAIDIGSSVGQFTFYFSKYCKKVYSFEPQLNPYKTSRIVNYLNKNAKIYNMAIGKYNCIKKFYINKNDTRSSFVNKKNYFYSEYVKIVNLNIFRIKKINFIKIDTEGYEMTILKSIRKKIIKDKTVLYIEINKSKNNLKVVKKIFPNYVVYADSLTSFELIKNNITTNVLLVPRNNNFF